MTVPELFRSALVVGTVRDASVNIEPDLLRIVNALSTIVPTLAFVVESDSSDSTVANLFDLAKRDSRIRFKSLGIVADKIPDRIQRLRYCRNVYVDEIRNNPLYRECGLIVVADLDGINTRIDSETFQLALNSNLPWDALAANQSARYYDILALRHPLWSPNSWVAEEEWLTPFLGKNRARKHAMSDRMIKIPSSFPPILVDSAFGGLCIYRRWVFEKCDYSEDTAESAEEIDHVSLHRKMRATGGKIFIHPGLINSHWTLHGLNGSPFIRTAKSISQFWPFRMLLPFLRKLSLYMAKKV